MKRNYSLLVSKSFYTGNLLVFLMFYGVFYYLYSQINYGNTAIFYIVNILMSAVFVSSAVNIRIGFYFFIFLVPLLNTITTIMGIRSVNFPVVLLFAFFMGFLLYFFGRLFKEKLFFIELKTGIDVEIGRVFLIFSVIVLISAVVAIFRYANFFPFITNNYHNLKININGSDSNGSIYWVIPFFLNYSIPFLIIFSLFNIFRKAKDILAGLVVIVASTTGSSLIAFYQYFFNPYLGSFIYWVETGRLNATFTDPNALGAYTILVFPVFLGLIIYFRQWYFKLVFIVLTIPLIL